MRRPPAVGRPAAAAAARGAVLRREPSGRGDRRRSGDRSGGSHGAGTGDRAGGGRGCRRADLIRAGRGGQGGAERDRVLRIGVHRDRAVEARRHELRDERDPGRATDQQDRGQVGRLDPGGGDGPAQHLDARLDVVADHLLELAAHQPHRRLQAGSSTGMRTSVSADSASLASTQSRAQPRHRGQHLLVRWVEPVERIAEALADVGEDRVVEVDPAETLDALGPAQQREAAVLADHRGVEGAAAQVVDRDDRARLDALGGGVADRGRPGLGEELDLEPATRSAVRIRSSLCVPQLAGVGERDAFRPSALALRRPGRPRARRGAPSGRAPRGRRRR